jgi:hypothetical protein
LTVKELNQYRFLVGEIKYLERKINAQKLTVSVQGSSPEYPYIMQNHTLEGIPASASGIVTKYCTAKLRAEQELDKLIDYITDIPDSQIRQIFSLRFIGGYKWNTVADIVGGGNTEDSIKKAVYRYLCKN